MGGEEAGGVGAAEMRGAGKQEERAGGEVIQLRSAGGVVVRGRGEKVRVAVIQSAAGEWVFPKGLIEEGEEPEEAARREIGEEVGLSRLALLGDAGWTEHEFEREGKWFRNRVHWFLYEAGARAAMRLDPEDEVLDCGWFGPKQALSLLTHDDHRRLLRQVISRVSRRRLCG